LIPVTGLTAIDVDKERIKLETQRQFIEDQKVRLPGITVTPLNPVGAAVIVHG
jgi:hypothetical protein